MNQSFVTAGLRQVQSILGRLDEHVARTKPPAREVPQVTPEEYAAAWAELNRGGTSATLLDVVNRTLAKKYAPAPVSYESAVKSAFAPPADSPAVVADAVKAHPFAGHPVSSPIDFGGLAEAVLSEALGALGREARGEPDKRAAEEQKAPCHPAGPGSPGSSGTPPAPACEAKVPGKGGEVVTVKSYVWKKGEEGPEPVLDIRTQGILWQQTASQALNALLQRPLGAERPPSIGEAAELAGKYADALAFERRKRKVFD